MDKVQLLAGRVVNQVLAEGRNLNQVLEAEMQAVVFSAQQRGALQDLCYGTLRAYGRLDFILGQLLHKPVHEEKIRYLLLVALYQLQAGRAAAHAVVDHAVRAARGLNPAFGGLVNAVLRNFQRQQDALQIAANQQDVSRLSYPQWWINRMRAQFGDEAEAVLQAGNQHPPMTLRVNIRRTTAEDYLNQLDRSGIEAERIGPDAILLARPLPVMKLPGFYEGLVSVQDAGAQFAARLLDVQDGMRVLDACAAPGGKTAHMLERAQLELLALDKDAQRLQRVRENLDRLGLEANLQCGDAAQPENWWDGVPFQRILADVPCSASGVVRRHPDIKWLRRPEDIAGFALQQEQILAALWRLLAKDGKLLYATCSLFEQENHQVVESFLSRNKEAKRLSVGDLGDGQLLPDGHHDGFFYALLQKSA